MTAAEIRASIIAAATAQGISPDLALAVAAAESNFNPNATSSAGAAGIFQLMPRTAAAYGVSNPYDPAQNIAGGVRMLADLERQYGGDVPAMLAAYNWGSGNLASGAPLPTETTNYIARVLRYLGISSADPQPAAATTAADSYSAPDWAAMFDSQESSAPAPSPSYLPYAAAAAGAAVLYFLFD